MMVFPKGFGKLNPMGHKAALHGEVADENGDLDPDDLA
jgi:hypothetical protein